jgi:hypothetical protein
MDKYSIIISSDNWDYEWGKVVTLKEAKKLASEIVEIGCFWLEDGKLTEDEIRSITINIYKDDKVYYSRKLEKSYQDYLINLNKTKWRIKWIRNIY